MGSISEDTINPAEITPHPYNPRKEDSICNSDNSSSSYPISTLSLPKHFKRNNNKNNFRRNIKLSERISSQKQKYNKMVTSNGGSRSTCANTIRRGRQPSVAIATQVLNPSSLKGQRLTKRFGRGDDDEEGFLTSYYRKKARWSRICYYGGAITMTILILMSFILIVGYLQSEKHKRTSNNASRSNKLIQERRPLSYVYTSTPPPSLELEPTDSQEFFPTTHSSFFLPSKETGGFESKEQFYNENEQDSQDSGEVGKSDNRNSLKEEEADGDDYIANYDLDDFEVKLSQNENDNKEGKQTEDDEGKEKENALKDIDNNDNTPASIDLLNQEKLDIDNDKELREDHEVNDKSDPPIMKEDDTISKGEKDNDPHLHQRYPSEVKVRPPQDFVFSVEIPIYKRNKTISSGDKEVNQFHRDKDAIPYFSKDSQVEHVHVDDDDDVDDKDNPINESQQRNENSKKVVELPLIITEVNDLTQGSSTDINSSIDDTIDAPTRDKDERKDSLEIIRENDKNETPIPIPVDDKFHESVLHTVLFDAEDDEKHDMEHVRNIDEDAPPSKKEERLPVLISRVQVEPASRNEKKFSRGRGRSRKIKIEKNDTTMNFKASYTPPGRKKNGNKISPSPLPKGTEDTPENVNEKIDLGNDKDNEEYGNIKDFVMEPYTRSRYSQATSSKSTSTRNNKRPTGPSSPGKEADQENENETVGNARLLSSSQTSGFSSNLEAIIRSILSPERINLLNSKETRKASHISPGASDFRASLTSNVNQFLPPTPPPIVPIQQSHIAPQYTGSALDLDASHLSKRTFNSEYNTRILDYPQSPSSSSGSSTKTENYFEHLLGFNPAVGSIGSPSVTGATLNNFYPNYNIPTSTQPSALSFDINSSGTEDSPRLAPGVVPLDLASSYIPSSLALSKSTFPSGNEQISNFGGNQFNLNHLPSNGNSNLDFNPYAYNGGGSIGTLTTLGGQVPTYNTISQGINLLNLMSGVIPPTYFHDQVYPHSHSQSLSHSPGLGSLDPSSSGIVHFENAPLPLPPVTLGKNRHGIGGSQPEPVSDTYAHSRTPSRPPFPEPYRNYDTNYDDHIFPSESRTRSKYEFTTPKKGNEYSNEETDQLPAASSFSQSILTSAKNPKFRENMGLSQESNKIPMKSSSSPKSNVIVTSQMKMNTTPKVKPNPIWNRDSSSSSSSQTSSSEPKSYSFEIIPRGMKITSGSSAFQRGNIVEDILHSSMDSSESASKSKKRAGANIDKTKENSKEFLQTTGGSGQREGRTMKLKGFGLGGKEKMKNEFDDRSGSKVSYYMKEGQKRKVKFTDSGLQSGFYPV